MISNENEISSKADLMGASATIHMTLTVRWLSLITIPSLSRLCNSVTVGYKRLFMSDSFSPTCNPRSSGCWKKLLKRKKKHVFPRERLFEKCLISQKRKEQKSL